MSLVLLQMHFDLHSVCSNFKFQDELLQTNFEIYTYSTNLI